MQYLNWSIVYLFAFNALCIYFTGWLKGSCFRRKKSSIDLTLLLLEIDSLLISQYWLYWYHRWKLCWPRLSQQCKPWLMRRKSEKSKQHVYKDIDNYMNLLFFNTDLWQVIEGLLNENFGPFLWLKTLSIVIK